MAKKFSNVMTDKEEFIEFQEFQQIHTYISYSNWKWNNKEIIMNFGQRKNNIIYRK